MDNDKRPFSQRQTEILLDFFEMAGIDLLNFAVLEARRTGEGTTMNGHRRPRRRAEVERCIGWAAAANADGKDVYFRPARFDEFGEQLAHPIIFFDDVSPEMADRVSRKYRSLVIQTSQGKCHVWLVTSKPLPEAERFAIQSALIPLIGGDPGSASGEHFGRAPGFRNRKPNRGNSWIYIRQMNDAGKVLNPTAYLVAEGVEPFLPKGGACAISSPIISRPTGLLASGDASPSAGEFGYAIHRIQEGRPIEWIVDKIAIHALLRGKRKTEVDARRYALLTVRRAEMAIGSHFNSRRV